MPVKATPSLSVSRDSRQTWVVAAAKLFVAVVVAVVLYVAHAAFIPIALALLLAPVLSAPVETFHKKGVPRGLSALLILLLALSLIGGTMALLWTPTQEWFAKAPQTMLLVKQKVRPVARFMDKIEEFRKSAGGIGGAPAAAATNARPAPPEGSASGMILEATGPMIASTLTFVMVSLFLLAGGPPMLARMTAALVSNLRSAHVLHIIEKVRGEVGHYYLVTTLINVGLGIATGTALWAWGLPTPFLWGALAGLLNYIPYAGAATTLVTVTLVAIVSFDTLGSVYGVAGTYLAIATLEGQVVQPLLVGRRMEVNPLLIFLGLWFGGLFWGIAGILLATPALVALKVTAENSKNAKSMTEFLGPNDQAPERDYKIQAISRRIRRS